MWLITADGMTSVVRYVPSKDKVNKIHRALAEDSDDPKDWLIIRARVKADLERVEQVSNLDLHIATDPKADYAYRGLCRTKDWQEYMATAIAAVDYDSHFKEVVRDRAPKVDGRYNGMMGMWSIMSKWQDFVPYSGALRASPTKGNWKSGWQGGWGGKTAASSAMVFGGSPDKSYTAPGEDLTPLFGFGSGSVKVEHMVDLIIEAGSDATKVPADKVDEADDAAFELWVRISDRNEAGAAVTPSEVRSTAEDIRVE